MGKLFYITLLLAAACFSGYAQQNTFVNNGEKVGIGTLSPQTPLTVYNTAGGGHITIQVSDVPAVASRADLDYQIVNGHTIGRISSYYSTSADGGSGGLWFWTRSNGNLQRNMAIDPNGNVGIGTSGVTGYKLAVQGDIIAESIKVAMRTNWPDFVFDTKYRLQPLEQVEQHIKQFKHLPNIPSAAEVKEKGLDLGANQAKLLQKIEELTLYLIDQNKTLLKQGELIKEQQELLLHQGKRLKELEEKSWSQ
ncbi:hypothetical protein SAMN05421820_101357 [Pedobacter steynii]|uniref:Uncharacterized protein n=1 Tax=Pedobacter steynii TaxID=430522 RepID=A0A1G9JSL5_9SPHI|nr:tail fiber protein [Pedobacter steynii]NQX38341.1 hypothetical protein [Pedobacter steynii]SDL40441.1 hypothetical protein SAMN05421820_101357 [Pedobacter steynii]